MRTIPRRLYLLAPYGIQPTQDNSIYRNTDIAFAETDDETYFMDFRTNFEK